MVRLVSIQRQALHVHPDARLQQRQPSARHRRQTRQLQVVQYLLVHLLRLLPVKKLNLVLRSHHLFGLQHVVEPQDCCLLLLLHLARHVHVFRLDDGVAARGR